MEKLPNYSVTLILSQRNQEGKYFLKFAGKVVYPEGNSVSFNIEKLSDLNDLFPEEFVKEIVIKKN